MYGLYWSITQLSGHRILKLMSMTLRKFRGACIPGFENYSYIERLHLLHMPRLEMRRMQNDLIWCYKILFGYVKICPTNFFEFRLSSTRGHPYKLFKQHCSNTTRSVFFAEWVINVWNSLPPDIVDFRTLKSLTRSIHTVDLSGYCIGSI